MSRRPALLVGSYEGQDSFGDKCLLRSVAARLRAAGEERLTSLVHDPPPPEVASGEFPGVEILPSLTRAVAAWRGRLGRLRLPGPARDLGAVALALGPERLLPTPRGGLARRALERIAEAGLVYFYGGTQLSLPWFDLNWPGLQAICLEARRVGVPVFFGPQQYGPQTTRQRARLLRAVRLGLVREMRTRNRGCLEWLGLPPGALLLDEVYSNVALHPLVVERPGRPTCFLANVRETNFVDPRQDEELRSFARLVLAVQRRTGLPCRLFTMSGPSFSDDTRILDVLREPEFRSAQVELQVSSGREQELIQLAGTALGAISMSFHGCILTMLGGVPAVPVSSGGYYDWKYSDFSRYTGSQAVPRLELAGMDPERAAGEVLSYFEAYDPAATAGARVAADRQAVDWYGMVTRGARP